MFDTVRIPHVDLFFSWLPPFSYMSVVSGRAGQPARGIKLHVSEWECLYVFGVLPCACCGAWGNRH